MGILRRRVGTANDVATAILTTSESRVAAAFDQQSARVAASDVNAARKANQQMAEDILAGSTHSGFLHICSDEQEQTDLSSLGASVKISLGTVGLQLFPSSTSPTRGSRQKAARFGLDKHGLTLAYKGIFSHTLYESQPNTGSRSPLRKSTQGAGRVGLGGIKIDYRPLRQSQRTLYQICMTIDEARELHAALAGRLEEIAAARRRSKAALKELTNHNKKDSAGSDGVNGAKVTTAAGSSTVNGVSGGARVPVAAAMGSAAAAELYTRKAKQAVGWERWQAMDAVERTKLVNLMTLAHTTAASADGCLPNSGESRRCISKQLVEPLRPPPPPLLVETATHLQAEVRPAVLSPVRPAIGSVLGVRSPKMKASPRSRQCTSAAFAAAAAAAGAECLAQATVPVASKVPMTAPMTEFVAADGVAVAAF